MGKQRAILLVGNVGTGKTTWVRDILQKDIHPEALVIDNDSLSTMLAGTGKYHYDEKKTAFYFTLKMQIFRSILSHGYTAIIDGTHIAKKNRKPYIEAAKSFGVPVLVVDFGPGDQESFERRCRENRGSSRSTWLRVHERSFSAYERPEYSEGINTIISPSGVIR